MSTFSRTGTRASISLSLSREYIKITPNNDGEKLPGSILQGDPNARTMPRDEGLVYDLLCSAI